ncbi:IucA/IucC family protein [Methylobacterium sp. WSM2598]|uniref:IucA/IucC family protein n=1 Tax=Methylobacterium sp. WSM2598 TaxID=398261 RepID=UPI00037DF9D5|nr:IucA/IucC family protein [Methylobacterium sp. WSM2598]
MDELGPRSGGEACRVATRCFLNSLMREWSGWSLHGDGEGAPVVVRVPLPARGTQVEVEVAHLSRVGQHAFRLPLREHRPGLPPRALGLPEFAAMVTGEPAIAGRAHRTRAVTFLRRVLHSLEETADLLADPAAPGGAFRERDPAFLEGEQALRFGHSVHPTPRSRDEFTRADARRYAPEYGRGFSLRWWSAAPWCVAQGASRARKAAALVRDLAEEDPVFPTRILEEAEGRVLLPMHPWQAARLALDPEVGALMRAGLVVDHGEAGASWFATSSLRSLYAPGAAFMLKVSLSLRLTNSARVIRPAEGERGLVVDRLLAGPVGERVAARFPRFRVLGEPAYLLLRREDGTALPQTMVVLRDNPFREGAGPAAVLAALCEVGPDGRESGLSLTIRRVAAREGTAPESVAPRWFRRFLEVAVAPLLVLQADEGLLFGAHQQNLVLGLSGGWPDRAWFRDCQGTGYVREALPALRAAAPGLAFEAGHLFGAPEAARIMGYYLVVNSLFSVVGALALAGLAAESDLIGLLRDVLAELAAGPLRDRTCLDHLLTSPTLDSKGNFMIGLRDIDENTQVTDPLAEYVPLPNPIAGR